MAIIDTVDASEITGGEWCGEPPLRPMTHFSIDSRKIELDQTFVGIKTDSRDGADYVVNAWEKGAHSAIVERAQPLIGLPQLVVESSIEALQKLAKYERSRFNGWIVGITGSYGKTTVKELVANFFPNNVHRTEGNLNNYLGVPLSLLSLSNAVHRGAIIEAGINQPGEMKLLGDMIEPDFAIITSVGPVHLEMLKTVEGVANEKAVLGQKVRAGGQILFPVELLKYTAFQEFGQDKSVYVLGEKEDLKSRDLAERYGYEFVCYNRTDDAKVGASEGIVVESSESSAFFRFKSASDGMFHNFALAAAYGLIRHIPAVSMQEAFSDWQPLKNRGEVFHLSDKAVYLDSYNANPVSMLDAVSAFNRLFPEQDHLYIFGGMNELGEYANSLHEEVGKSLHLKENSLVVLVGEDAALMKQGILQGGIVERNVWNAETVDEARLVFEKHSGAVMIKGSRSYMLEALLERGNS